MFVVAFAVAMALATAGLVGTAVRNRLRDRPG
jgi:hypothetical protein